MEDLYIRCRFGRAESTGFREKTRRGTFRNVTKFVERYKTDAGVFLHEEWIKIVRECVEASGSQELLERIKEHCRANCVWLKSDTEIESYSLNILVGRIYRHWKGFSLEGLTEKTTIIYIDGAGRTEIKERNLI